MQHRFLHALSSFVSLTLLLGSTVAPVFAQTTPPTNTAASNKCWYCPTPGHVNFCIVADRADGVQVQPGLGASPFTLNGCTERTGSCEGMTPRTLYTSVNDCGRLSIRTIDTTLTFPQETAPPASQDPSATPATTPPRPFRSINPNPAYPIPGVEFTPATQNGTEVAVPFLAQYIGGLFRFAIGIGAVAASAMIVYGGFRYLMAASLPDVKDGKETIKDAILGLVVLLGSYVILQTINPELLNLQPLSLSVVQTEAINNGEGSGDPNPSQEPGAYGSGSPQDNLACGAGRNEQKFGRQFYVLPLRNGGYIQGASPWGPIAYGPNLNEDPAQSNDPAPGSSPAEQRGHIGTIGQGGCGAASVATIAAYYGVTVSDPSSSQLADNSKIWVRGQLLPLTQASPRIATLLRARTQPHLFDPLDAAKLASRPGGGRVVNGGTTRLTFVRWIPGDFSVRGISPSPTRSQEVRRLIQAGSPVLFHCHLCQMNQLQHPDAPTTGSENGHFMVLRGVSQDGQHFLIHDVGYGNDSPRKGYTISAQEIDTARDNRVAIWDVHPANRSVQNCGNPTNSTAGPGTTSGSSRPTSVVSGGVRVQNFTYRPPGGDAGWEANQSFFMLPDRLMTELNRYPSGNPQRPRLHLYIYLHGQNGGKTPFNGSVYPPLLRRPLEEVAGSKNVIIAGPHYRGNPYMQRLVLRDFYDKLLIQLASTIPGFQASDIRDVVIGGHSAATCGSPRGGPSGILLTQAIQRPLIPNLRAVVAYDGCLGISYKRQTEEDGTVHIIEGGHLTARNFTPPAGVNLYLNPDLGGMGIDSDFRGDAARGNRFAAVRREWDLPRVACPSYMPSLSRRVECYGKTESGREIYSFETHTDHQHSVELMTKIMLRALYQ